MTYSSCQPFRPETWPLDADGFVVDLCTECGTPVRYGSRHSRCGTAVPANRLTVETAPIGTKAPACIGGYWIKTERGWKWCTGSTFPRPGGDWTGELIPPQPAAA